MSVIKNSLPTPISIIATVIESLLAPPKAVNLYEQESDNGKSNVAQKIL